MEDLNVSKRAHKLTLSNRKSCTITGVTDVLSFDVGEVLLETDQGMLMLKGKGDGQQTEGIWRPVENIRTALGPPIDTLLEPRWQGNRWGLARNVEVRICRRIAMADRSAATVAVSLDIGRMYVPTPVDTKGTMLESAEEDATGQVVS